jgi:tetratricopeptide (TPR) repeat protein
MVALTFRRTAFLACVVGGVLLSGARGQNLPSTQKDPALQLELEYVRGLQELQLPEYADLVIGVIKTKYPQAAAEIKVLELRGLLEQGKFDEVKAIIAKQAQQDSNETWAMKIALADGFYAWGKFPEARGIYEAFFKRYPQEPPPAINDFFMQAAYKYAQMLVLVGDRKGAVGAYRTALRAKMERYVSRQLIAELAELILTVAEDAPAAERTTLCAEADKLACDLLWQNDLWFGRAVVIRAHVELLKGNADGAAKMIADYRPQLKEIDDALKAEAAKGKEDLTRLSPMAQCRYLLGVIMHDKAGKILGAGGDKKEALDLLIGKTEAKTGKRADGAYQHLINVFVLYPSGCVGSRTRCAGRSGSRRKTM